jgi:hypothetical protein
MTRHDALSTQTSQWVPFRPFFELARRVVQPRHFRASVAARARRFQTFRDRSGVCSGFSWVSARGPVLSTLVQSRLVSREARKHVVAIRHVERHVDQGTSQKIRGIAGGPVLICPYLVHAAIQCGQPREGKTCITHLLDLSNVCAIHHRSSVPLV